ncbi:MAG TPA: sugar ABC transporter permease [Candidatus Rifleibacterium sp.]|nr:sugar ABC transporter permease [Candidatus Rifleibacterium sp.]HPW57385.1 sugar ABC transporter permease [Candidatus Rifleibacterium sp.]
MAIRTSQDTAVAAGFLSPFMLLFGTFLIFPIFYSFYLSFFGSPTDYSLSNLEFVGLANYKRIMTDFQFWWSLGVTALYGVISIPLGICASLALALLLDNKLFGKSFFRSAFFLPNVLDMLVVGVIWTLIYAPKFGALAQITTWLMGENNFFNTTGLLGSPYTALLAVVIAMVLKGAGFGMVLFLAALQNIPEAVYEAADIDGASEWQKFTKITVPLLRPIIIFMVITGVIGSLNAFTEIYAMTSGGPQVVMGGETVGSTSVAGYYLFKQFDSGNYGYAAAISYMLLIITLGITWLQQRIATRNDAMEAKK